MAKKIVKKIFYKIEFTLNSSLAIGSGQSEFTDKDIVKNSKGIPFIPGSAVAGVFRSQIDKDLAKKYFGFVEINKSTKSEEKVTSEDSKLLIYDANIAANDIKNVRISYRDGVALDEYKTAIKGEKFDMEVLEPGVKFVTYMEQNIYEDKLDEDKLDEAKEFDLVVKQILDACFDNKLYFGAKTMRGYGEIGDVVIHKKIFNISGEMNDKNTIENNQSDASYSKEAEFSLDKYLEFDMYSDSSWEDASDVTKTEKKNYALLLELKLAGGISVRRYTTDTPENENDKVPDYEQLTVNGNVPVIPGTTWAGAFRHRMGSLVPTSVHGNELWGSIEGKKSKSKIRFSESQIEGGEFKTLSRNAINRFTGGTEDGALYTEKTYYGGKTTLKISFDMEPGADVKKALAAAITDLHFGFLSIGGLTAVGRGLFTIEKVNGKDVVTQDETGSTLYKMILDCLKNDDEEKIS